MIPINEIESFVALNYGHFGINKNREIVRLIFEITKRDGLLIRELGIPEKEKNYARVKAFLLKKRYPKSFNAAPPEAFYLPKTELNKKVAVKISNYEFNPKNIFIEKSAERNDLSDNICGLFPSAKIAKIDSIKEFSRNCKFKLEDYNNRSKNLFLIEEKYDFFKPCPCTAKVLPCGYNLINLGFGCPYECTYCFLQGYQNFPGIIIPVNLKNYFEKFIKPRNWSNVFPYARIGSGEFTDSLVFDNLTGFSKEIIDFFSKFPEIYFEFKTKSANIENLLKCKPQKNIVVSWSLNPQKVIAESEFYSASLAERIDCAKLVSKAGFGVGFHFDPIIYSEYWEKFYPDIVEMIFSAISPEKVYWISLGTLRLPKELKKSIENRFPENTILDAELLLGKDNKLRYSENLRIRIYKTMVEKIKKYSSKTITYLCMEPKDIWQKSGL